MGIITMMTSTQACTDFSKASAGNVALSSCRSAAATSQFQKQYYGSLSHEKTDRGEAQLMEA
jgi:hypothetical protein